MPPTFQGKSFLLTYPQDAFTLDTDWEPALSWFGSRGDLTYLRIGVEQHKTGDPHWHAVVSYNTKLRVGSDFFNYRDKHPNVQSVGRRIIDWKRCIDYVAKDGHFREHGAQRHGKDSVWPEVAEANTREEAMALVKSAAPREYVIHRRNIDYALDQMFPLQPYSAFQPRPASAFCVPDELMQWVHGSLMYETYKYKH